MTINFRTLAVFLTGSCAMLDIYSTQPLLAEMTAEFGVAATRGSWTITATTLAVALAAPFAGSISDYVGRKCVMVPAVLGLTIATILCAFSPTLEIMILLRFIQGLFIPFIFAVAIAYIGEEWDSTEGAKINAIYISGSVFGGFCGRFISGIATANAGWRSSFIALALYSSIVVIVIVKYLPREKNFRPANSLLSSFSSMGTHSRNSQFLATCFVGATIMFVQVALFTYATLYLAAAPFSLSSTVLGSIFAVFLIGVIITPIAGNAIYHFGYKATFIAACSLAWCGLVLCLLPQVAAIIVGLACCSTGVFIGQACATSYAAFTAGEAKSSGVGLYLTCYYLGGSLGAILPAPIFRQWGWLGCILLFFIVFFLGLIVAVRCWPNRVWTPTANTRT